MFVKGFAERRGTIGSLFCSAVLTMKAKEYGLIDQVMGSDSVVEP